ncbi:MAG: dihydroorotase [Alistipes senegalensis]|nr:dihydroorotase [Alistipes senegalensis]
MKTIYKNARIWRDGHFEPGSIAVEDGHIVASCEPAPGDRCIDLAGRLLVPGLVDVHVHLREPGFPHKETIATGTVAAARGGYTAVCAMPNLRPAPDAPDTLAQETEIIRRDAVVRVYPYGCITMGQRGAGELVDFAALAHDVVGFSDDGRGVQADELMERAMRGAATVGKPIVAHCEVDELLRGGYVHDGIYCREHGHRGICSESEWRQVERDIALAEKTGCQYHVCHVSTAESVELVRRAKARGVRVSCETAPHYLLLCDEDLQEDGRFKMNPPLRSRADRDALREGLRDGTIEVIATDHAPHTAEEKSRGLAGSAMGIVGLECAFPVLYTGLVRSGLLPLERLVASMTDNPRRIFGLEGGLHAGKAADFTVLDLDDEFVIDPDAFRSKGRATPFAGWGVQGRAVLTVVGGRTVYEAEA